MWKAVVNEKFIDQVQHRLPASDQVDNFVDACRTPLKKSITINTNKISVEKFLELTKPWWRHLEANRFTNDPTSFYIDREDLELALGRTFLYQSWFFYIQEVAAALPATQIDLHPWDIILDMCAAPGGKTSQLANALLKISKPTGPPLEKGGLGGISESKDNVHSSNPWLIVANDVNGQRVGTLAHNLNQWWCYNTFLTKFNGWSFGSNLPNFFDHVLLDAPCSGEWTGYKSDFALKFRNQAEINKICGTQLQLLVSAIKAVKVGGTVVYSTCTLNPFENEGTLAKAFEFFWDSIQLVDIHFQNLEQGITRSTDDRSFDQADMVGRCRPHLQKTGWFFIAKIRKLADPKDLKIQKDHKLLPRNQFKVDQSKWLQKKVWKRMDENFGIKTDENIHRFVSTKEKVYLCSPVFRDISPQLNAEKMWIPVAKIDRYGYRPTHYLWNMLGHLATKHVVEFTKEQIQTYSERHDVPLADIDLPKLQENNRYLIIQRNGYGMSVGKMVDDIVKNKFGK